MSEKAIASTILPIVPPDRLKKLRFIPDGSRLTGLLFVAPPGWGKSRVFGRSILFQDAWRGVPSILLDPTCGAIGNFTDKLIRQPKEIQQIIGKRVRLVSLSADHNRVTAWPVFSSSNGRDLYEAPQFWPDIVIRQDKNLREAPLLGWNSFHPLATAVAMICIALQTGIAESIDLVLHPEQWRDQGRFAQAFRKDPSCAPALSYFLDEYIPNTKDRGPRSAAFLAKARLFTWSDRLLATFNATEPGIDWDEVARKRLIVLIDFSGLTDEASIQFSMLLILRSFTNWLKRRGQGRHLPIALTVDEFSAVAAGVTTDQEMIAADLREIVARLARAHSLWLTLGMQEVVHASEPVQRVLAMMSNQIYGATSDYDTAVERAQRFDEYNDMEIKYFRPIYGSDGISQRSVMIDEEPVLTTVEEQLVRNARRYLCLSRYHWQAAIASGEGRMPTTTIPVTTKYLDSGQYVDEEQVAKTKQILLERDWPLIADVIGAESARRTVPIPAAPEQAIALT